MGALESLVLELSFVDFADTQEVVLTVEQTIYIVGLSESQLQRIEAAGYAIFETNGVRSIPITVTRQLSANMTEIANLIAVPQGA